MTSVKLRSLKSNILLLYRFCSNAGMRYWFMVSLCNLLSVCVLMILFGQREEAKLLMIQEEQQRKLTLPVDTELTDRRAIKEDMQKLVDQAGAVQESLKAEVTKLTGDKEEALKSKNNCITDEATIKLEQENKENELNEVKGNQKSELENLEAKFNQLKMQLEQHSEICKYVMMDKFSVTLCGSNNNKESQKEQSSPKDTDPVLM
ncbi:uncharacterized protein LOC142989538 [Genypterus blacodes]|uniref:uncharacterized protein LOC142989538 n=1 Tax=Genypterus blacodes TaxID=154954 RepID=UPI003F7602C4